MGTKISTRHVAGLSTCAWILAVVLAGCGEQKDLTSPVVAPARADVAGNTVAVNEPAALRELTRATALAMRDAAIRQEVGREMREHGVTHEHKLELRSFVEANAGGLLLAKMSQRSGLSRDSLARLIAAVRPLEFYMPVRAHRRAWRGGDVLVASQLRESDPVVAFDENGTAVAVGSAVPEMPTLALVPVETDFTTATVPSRSATTAAAHSTAHFPTAAAQRDMISDCDPAIMLCDSSSDLGGGSTPSIPSAAPTGLYMTFTDLYDAHEPWIKGDPELEAHVMGPSATDPSDLVRPLHCSGQNESGWYRFDQNADQWSGAVLLYTQVDMQKNGFTVQTPDNRQFAISLFEDDYQSCVIHDDGSRFWHAFVWASLWAAKSFGLVSDCNSLVCSAIVFAIYTSETVRWTWSVATTNDDYVGLAVDRKYVPAYTGWNATHALMDDSTLNGGIKLQWHVYGQ